MFKAVSYSRGCVHVTHPRVPWKAHYIFGTGWAGVYLLYSENGRDALYDATLTTLNEITVDFGPEIARRTGELLGKKMIAEPREPPTVRERLLRAIIGA